MMIDAGVLQIVAVVAILGFMWTLHRDVSNLCKEVGKDMADLRQKFGKDISEVRKDMAGLRERIVRVESCMEAMDSRIARVEGLLEGFVGRQPEPQS